MKLIINIFLIFCVFITKAQCYDGISCLSESVSDYWRITIINNSKDTIYLFDTYLKDSTQNNSSLFYRYSKKNKKCIIEYAPMLPYLSVKRTDLIIVGSNSYVNKGQSVYEFSKICPYDSANYYIKKKHNNLAYKSINYRLYSKFSHSLKFKRVKLPSNYELECRLAYYKNISTLTSYEDYYYNEIEFNKQALSYDEIIIPLGHIILHHR